VRERSSAISISSIHGSFEFTKRESHYEVRASLRGKPLRILRGRCVKSQEKPEEKNTNKKHEQKRNQKILAGALR
jgi:hypothetical protein